MIDSPRSLGGRYRIGGILGAGGMGSVYRAFDRLMQRHVALKLVDMTHKNFTLSLSTDRDDPRLLLANEFKVLSALHHPNIIGVLDYGFDQNQRPFYTMELLDTAQNFLIVASERDFDGKIDLLFDILQGLSYLHRHKVTHNDLKPSNILVNDGRAKILDFGLALQHAPDSQMRGTLGYMSPEMIRGELVTMQSDLYSFGVIAYEIFVGNRPFEFHTVSQYISKVLTVLPDLEPLRQVVGDEVALLIGNLLAKDPHDRPDSAYAVMQALSHALNRAVIAQSHAERDSFLRFAPFVGRKTELTQLEQAYQMATQRQGSAWVIAGENGVGKSRLMEELRTLALVNGAIVLKGQALEGGGLSQQIWRDVVRRLILSVDIDDNEAAIMKMFVQDIESLLERPIPELSQTVQEKRLIRTIGKIFRRQTRPILILLEDLQWASDSLELLNHVARTVSELPVLIVGNYRSDEHPYLYGKLSNMRLLNLNRFNEDEIRELSIAMLGQVGERTKLVKMLQRETEGNLFFMIDVIHVLAQDVKSLESLNEITLPSSVFAHGMLEVTQRRLKQLHLDYHPMLRIAAVIGRNIDIDLLENIDSEFDPYEWIQACVNVSILELSNDQWRFTHDKLRDGILLEIDPRQLPKLHRMVAQAMETVYPNNPIYSSVLLEHWRIAGDIEKEAQYVTILAEQRMNNGQYHSAEEFFLRAINLIPHNNKYQLTDIYLLLAETYTLMSDYENAQDYYDKCILFVEPNSLQMAQLLFGFATVELHQKQYNKANDNLFQALELTKTFKNTVWECKVLNLLGRCALERHDYASANEYFIACADLAKQDGNLVDKAIAFNYLGSVAHFRQEFKLAESFYQKSLYLAQKIGHTHIDNLAQLSLALVHHDSAQLEAAAQYYFSAYEHATQSEDSQQIAQISAHFSRYFFQIGNIPTGLEILQEGLQIALNLRSRLLLAQFSLSMAWWQYQKGNKLDATQLIGVAFSQSHITRLDHTRMQALITRLESDLSKEIYTANYQIGAHRHFWQTMESYQSKIMSRF